MRLGEAAAAAQPGQASRPARSLSASQPRGIVTRAGGAVTERVLQ
jgi:hypothetical protein